MSSECKGDALAAGLDGVGTDRRSGADRRRLSAWTLVRGGITPRRRGSRRHGDHEALVDWHEPYLLFVVITILLLSVADAFMTLTLLMHGAREANPVLEYVLSRHPEMFAAFKMTLTGGGVVVLVVLARARLFRLVRARTILSWCLLGYTALLAYEWWLFGQAL